MLLGPGANPRYRGLARLTVAVRDLEQACRDYEGMFGFAGHEEIKDDPPGSRGMVLSLDNSPLGQQIVLATPVDDASPLAQRLGRQGEGIYSFGIAVSDLDGELDRLRALDINVQVDEKSSPARALIDPEALRGLRVELVTCSPDL
jgi:catechol 2,3-dioxygenase-like lactoylglutathione lyase family enzyme